MILFLRITLKINTKIIALMYRRITIACFTNKLLLKNLQYISVKRVKFLHCLLSKFIKSKKVELC